MLTIEQATETRRRSGRRRQTPWGLSDDAPTIFADGIEFYTTPSHGGFLVATERLAQMPAELRKTDLRYCGASWFEEDCEATLVVLAFPDAFTADERVRAMNSLKAWYPTKYAAYLPTVHAQTHLLCARPIDAAIVGPCEREAGHAGPCRAYSLEQPAERS